MVVEGWCQFLLSVCSPARVTGFFCKVETPTSPYPGRASDAISLSRPAGASLPYGTGSTPGLVGGNVPRHRIELRSTVCKTAALPLS